MIPPKKHRCPPPFVTIETPLTLKEILSLGPKHEDYEFFLDEDMGVAYRYHEGRWQDGWGFGATSTGWNDLCDDPCGDSPARFWMYPPGTADKPDPVTHVDFSELPTDLNMTTFRMMERVREQLCLRQWVIARPIKDGDMSHVMQSLMRELNELRMGFSEVNMAPTERDKLIVSAMAYLFELAHRVDACKGT